MQANALVRGLLVLECFSPHNDSYTLAELSRIVDIPKSSLYRAMKTLSEMNYLRYDEQSRRYYLGTRVLSLGFSVLQSMELREIARPYLEKLSRECNKTVNLAILDKHEMVYVERVRVPGLREFNISIGNRIPLWNTAVGKAVLAYIKPEKLKELVKHLSRVPQFRLARRKFEKALERVRNDGFALNNQEFLRGVRAVAVPIYSPDGVNCAINIVAEPEDVSIEELKKYYAPKLVQVGKELSRALGYQA